MSTFSAESLTGTADTLNSVDKDNPTKADIAQADAAVATDDKGAAVIPASNPNEPTELLNESSAETGDRLVASTELSVGDVTHPETQGDSAHALDAKEKIVPGAASGPDDAGVVRNDHGKVAYAPPGSLDAAFNGVAQDASGHVASVGTNNSSQSGVRV